MTSSTTTPRAWALRALALVLVIVLAISVYVAITSFRDVRAHDRAETDRRAATVAAEEFALRMDNFQATNAAAYTDDVEKMMTTKGKADFAQVEQVISQVFAAAQPTGKAAKEGQQAPTGKIVYVGISDIDDDSATVLVAHDTSVTNSTKQLHFRWTVELKKVDGKWLVDGLPPEVTGGSGQ